MNRNVLQTILDYNMIQKGDRIFVALSGGADSVALLHLLCSMRQQLGFSVVALHLNHQLRGKESDRDERFVRELCRRWKVPVKVGRAPVGRIAARKGLSVEESARRVRYWFLFRHAQGARDKIATGHTRSDTVETVLINLVRGTGLQGLGGIPPVRDRVIRPMIRCTREQVEQYCARHKLRYVTDSSNLSDDHTRNRIRRYVVPHLAKENPRFEQAAGEMAELLREDAAFLERLAAKSLRDLERPDGSWSRQGFLALAWPLRTRVLRRALEQKGLRIDRERLCAMGERIVWGAGGMQLSAELSLYCSREYFSIEALRKKPHRRPPRDSRELEFMLPPPGGELEIGVFPGKKLRMYTAKWPIYKKTLNNTKTLLKNVLDYDKIEKIAKLRQLKPADRIRPMGRGCTKTVKNLWSEAKVPAGERRNWASLWDSHGIIWAEQWGADEARTPSDDTGLVLVIEEI